MTIHTEKILDYMQNEYQNRLANNPDMTDDGARMFNIDGICKACSLERSIVEEETSNLKQIGYVKKWISGIIVLETD